MLNNAPNQAASVDAPIVSLSAFVCQRRRATEQRPAYPVRMFLLLLAVMVIGQASPAATNDILPLRTNFVSGTSLSTSELDTVVKLANLCGIQKVLEVSTELHLGGTTIQVAGDEKVEGRSVIFKALQIYPRANRRVRPIDAPSLGDFWAGGAKAGQQERTIVHIGDREVRVGLRNGIKPAGADKIVDAFVKGRVRNAAVGLNDELSGVDVTQPSWIGISQGKPYITFASSRNVLFRFTMDGDQITIVDIVRLYE